MMLTVEYFLSFFNITFNTRTFRCEYRPVTPNLFSSYFELSEFKCCNNVLTKILESFKIIFVHFRINTILIHLATHRWSLRGILGHISVNCPLIFQYTNICEIELWKVTDNWIINIPSVVKIVYVSVKCTHSHRLKNIALNSYYLNLIGQWK